MIRHAIDRATGELIDVDRVVIGVDWGDIARGWSAAHEAGRPFAEGLARDFPLAAPLVQAGDSVEQLATGIPPKRSQQLAQGKGGGDQSLAQMLAPGSQSATAPYAVQIHLTDPIAVARAKGGGAAAGIAFLAPGALTSKVYDEIASQTRDKLRGEGVDAVVSVVSASGGAANDGMRTLLIGAGAGVVGVGVGALLARAPLVGLGVLGLGAVGFSLWRALA